MSARSLTGLDALGEVRLRGHDPRGIVFWSGAGISRDAPTCAPLGAELTTRALDEAFEYCCLSRIRDYYVALRVKRDYPRLETVLDVLNRIAGGDALTDVLSDLVRPLPNDVHAFLARHLDSGGQQLTANFDDCIERSRSAPTADELLHFHGSFRADPSGKRLGATLTNIQDGFPAETAERFRATMTSPDTKGIVIVGYSGYDAFDVSPFLRSLGEAKELQGKRILWVRFRRSAGDRVLARRDSCDGRVQGAFERFRDAGAECSEVEGEARTVLDAFAADWGWPGGGLPAPSPCPASWAPSRTATHEERRRASLELYAMMGLHHEVRRLFNVHPPETKSELDLAAESAAADGRYRDAARLWRQAFPGDTSAERARREERLASCWWREGRLLKAYRHLRREVEQAVSSGVGGLMLWRLVSTTAHVFGHMRRRPLLRYFPTERRRRFFASHLPPPMEDGSRVNHGPHVDAMLAAARSRLGVAQEHSEEAAMMFDEAEALHGMLNFRHASLRHRGCHKQSELRPHPREYLEQVHDFSALGLSADAARVSLLPGASRVFNPYDVWRGLGRADFTPWHRLMLFGGYLTRYARGR